MRFSRASVGDVHCKLSDVQFARFKQTPFLQETGQPWKEPRKSLLNLDGLAEDFKVMTRPQTRKLSHTWSRKDARLWSHSCP